MRFISTLLFTVIGVVLGWAMTNVVKAPTGVQPGDLLAAAAAFAGVLIAVWGSMFANYVEQRNRQRDDDKLLREGLQELLDTITSIKIAPAIPGELAERQATIVALHERLNTARELLKYVRATAKTRNTATWGRLWNIENKIGEHDTMLQNEANWVAGEHLTENILQIHFAETANFADTIMPLLSEAIKGLR
jgi:hypothetical protein